MERLKLIQCGVGGFGGRWIRSYTSQSPDFELVATVDISPQALAAAGEQVNLPPKCRFNSLEAALEKVEADAVLTVTPPAVHLEHAQLAFERGLHLMTEKPIADTLENARRMVRLAERAGRQLVVSQNYRFSPVMQTLQRTLATRPLGEFGHGHIDFYIPADFTGSFREKMPYVLLVDMAIHHLDLIRSVTRRNIVKVYASTFRPDWSWYEHHSALKMILELEGGGRFSYSGDWSGRGQSTDWNGNWRLQCAEGSLHYESGQVILSRSARGIGTAMTREQVSLEQVPLSGQAATLRCFADAIRTGAAAEISGQDNLWSFGAVMAGVLSSQQDRPVEVAPLLQA